MEPQGYHRKFTAILSADVAGYSRLMQDDEAAPSRLLKPINILSPILLSSTATGWLICRGINNMRR
jgi:hypothetical protein